MDILKPQLQYIDDICYRLNPGTYCADVDQGAPQPYYEFDSECHELNEPEAEEDYDVEKEENGRYITRFHVPKIFFSYIIGSKGMTRRRLEGETKTSISVPKFGCDGDIVISGAIKKAVCSARNRVNMLVLSARKKQKLTHFLSIPLNNDTIMQRFKEFKDGVLASCPDMEEDLFQFPCNLHLTIGVLKLFDKVERDLAAEALDYCQKNLLSGVLGSRRELRVRMQGLDYLNDDPTAINVLYAKVISMDDSSLLQNLMDTFVAYFIQKGLIDETNQFKDNVLVHATLMNTKFLPKDETQNRKIKTFNAAPILEAYKDFDFGEASISQIDLSILRPERTTGYWPSTASINLFKF